MALFGKREIVFKTVGDKPRWRGAKEALKTAGIKIREAGDALLMSDDLVVPQKKAEKCTV